MTYPIPWHLPVAEAKIHFEAGHRFLRKRGLKYETIKTFSGITI